MNDKAFLAVKIIDILKKYDDEIHMVIKQYKKNTDPFGVSIIPILIEKSDGGADGITNRYDKIPVSSLKNSFRCINVGYGNSSSNDEKKVYFSQGSPLVRGNHKWAYKCVPSTVSEIKNFCKIKFNTNKFMYVIDVENIDNNSMVLEAVEDIIGYL